MTTLTPARRTSALLALSLGGFAIGTTEFVAMGLLPNIAQALLPGQYDAHPQAGIAHAGLLVSAYALGVVVGAPTIAAMSSRWPRKRLLLVLLVAFTVGTVASAVLPTFGLVVLARFVAGLPHGAYFGVASIVAGEIMGPRSRGKGVAMVLGGLTIANIVGVPAVTFVGQTAGWRVAYGVVALLFALTFVAVLALVPFVPAAEGASIGRELGALKRPQVWIMVGLGSFGFGGVAGLGADVLPFVLVAFGVGMTVGNVVGGYLADWSVKRTIYIGLESIALALAVMFVLSPFAVGVFVGAFLIGCTSSIVLPSVQARLMDVSGEAHTIGAALVHSAFNIGNSIGAALGGAVIAAGLGYRAPAAAGIGLAIVGLGIITVSYAVERRTGEYVRDRAGTGTIRTVTGSIPTVTSPIPLQ
jgi:MFS transporter, DHA1 family, inner membrane transport protein